MPVKHYCAPAYFLKGWSKVNTRCNQQCEWFNVFFFVPRCLCASKSAHFHSTPAPSFKTNGKGSLVVQHLFSISLPVVQDIVHIPSLLWHCPFGLLKQAGNTPCIGQAGLSNWNIYEHSEHKESCISLPSFFCSCVPDLLNLHTPYKRVVYLRDTEPLKQL